MTREVKNLQQARDLLLPGLYRYDHDGDLYVSDASGELKYVKGGVEPPVTVLSQSELKAVDFDVVKQRMGWRDK